MKVNKSGKFVISLDFELMWGVFDKRSVDSYVNIKETKKAVKQILNLFEKYQIHATWAYVGMLENSNKKEFQNNIPSNLPSYFNKRFNPYGYEKTIDELTFSRFHSAIPELNMIENQDGQELATHTYSHYYCLETGPSIDSFEKDLERAISIALKKGRILKTIVFPRNQYSKTHLEILKKMGIKNFRGTENGYLHKTRNQKGLNLIIRILRFIDSFINLTGYNTFQQDRIYHNGLFNVPSSMFLRPMQRISFLNKLHLKRIKDSMSEAANNNKVFHLWWHPHNFGKNLKSNLLNLELILLHFEHLKRTKGMESLNIQELTSKNEKNFNTWH